MYKLTFLILFALFGSAAFGGDVIMDHYKYQSPDKRTLMDLCPTGVPEQVPTHCVTPAAKNSVTSLEVLNILDQRSVLLKQKCEMTDVTCLKSKAVQSCLTDPVLLYPMRPMFKVIIQDRKPSESKAPPIFHPSAPTILVSTTELTYEPSDEFKGHLGRLYLYAASTGCVDLSPSENKLYTAWNLTYPPSPAEVARELFNNAEFKVSNHLTLDYIHAPTPCLVRPNYAICTNPDTQGVQVHIFPIQKDAI